MASLKQTILSLLAQLQTIQVTNGDGIVQPLYARIWNNQIKEEIDGNEYIANLPAAYVEVVPKVDYQELGKLYKAADLGFRIHVLHVELDTGDGITMEQNVRVYGIRDQIDYALTDFQPTACGPLVMVHEEPDFNHTNVYHYVLDFVTHFVNSAAVRPTYLDNPPLDLETDVILASGISIPVIYNTVQPLETLAAFYTADADGIISIFVTDANGNSIAGATIVSVQMGILPLPPKDAGGVQNWTWDGTNGFINFTTVANGGNGVSLAYGQQVAILYNQVITG